MVGKNRCGGKPSAASLRGGQVYGFCSHVRNAEAIQFYVPASRRKVRKMDCFAASERGVKMDRFCAARNDDGV
jgi:hypothetical protein